jgi:hypothetical protein
MSQIGASKDYLRLISEQELLMDENENEIMQMIGKVAELS